LGLQTGNSRSVQRRTTSKPGPIAITMANRKVNFLTREVDVPHRCGHSQIDVGMGRGKPTEPMHQPWQESWWAAEPL